MKIDRTLATTRNEVHHSAVTGSVNILSAQDRATVVMACGTGKTLVELGVAEKVL
jgi:superfamily II DNA or RNA helicase